MTHVAVAVAGVGEGESVVRGAWHSLALAGQSLAANKKGIDRWGCTEGGSGSAQHYVRQILLAIRYLQPIESMWHPQILRKYHQGIVSGYVSVSVSVSAVSSVLVVVVVDVAFPSANIPLLG